VGAASAGFVRGIIGLDVAQNGNGFRESLVHVFLPYIRLCTTETTFPLADSV
jgi:hypothetical protein